MMIVGMHFSAAGGVYKAVERAHELGCNALQIFAQNPRSWRSNAPSHTDVKTFRRLVSEYEIEAVVIHTPYLINLASPDKELVAKSRQAIRISLSRADLLGAQNVVTHIGSGRGRPVEDAIRAVAQGLDEILSDEYEAQLVLELTAGSGNIIGSTFAELARIIEASHVENRLCVCLDTAHAYASGYDVATRAGLEETLDDLDRHIGYHRLKVVHVNDTKVKLGSHVDRHYHIGLGAIGLDGFRNIANHERLSHLPFILETPVDDECGDSQNLKTFTSLFNRA
ncbi:deoxyribonuclease IV [bacterium]|nr:deoxyribonuclease IV [bacterium]